MFNKRTDNKRCYRCKLYQTCHITEIFKENNLGHYFENNLWGMFANICKYYKDKNKGEDNDNQERIVRKN